MVGGEGVWSAVFPTFTFWLSWLPCIYNRDNKANTNHLLFSWISDTSPILGKAGLQLSASPLLGSTKLGNPQNPATTSPGEGTFLQGLGLASRPRGCFDAPTVPAVSPLSSLTSVGVSQFMAFFCKRYLGRSISYMPSCCICTPLDNPLQIYNLKVRVHLQRNFAVHTFHCPQE